MIGLHINIAIMDRISEVTSFEPLLISILELNGTNHEIQRVDSDMVLLTKHRYNDCILLYRAAFSTVESSHAYFGENSCQFGLELNESQVNHHCLFWPWLLLVFCYRLVAHLLFAGGEVGRVKQILS